MKQTKLEPNCASKGNRFNLKSNIFLCSLFFLNILVTSVDAAPVGSLDARMASCDPKIVRGAVNEVLQDPNTLKEPLMLLRAASSVRIAGDKEEAAFLYLAGRLRVSRQVLFERGG